MKKILKNVALVGVLAVLFYYNVDITYTYTVNDYTVVLEN